MATSDLCSATCSKPWSAPIILMHGTCMGVSLLFQGLTVRKRHSLLSTRRRQYVLCHRQHVHGPLANIHRRITTQIKSSSRAPLINYACGREPPSSRDTAIALTSHQWRSPQHCNPAESPSRSMHCACAIANRRIPDYSER